MAQKDASEYDPSFMHFVTTLTLNIRLLAGPVVNVFVGPKRKGFHIHKALLRASCAYFKERIDELGDKDDETNADYYLPDDDAEVFALLHTWLYRQQLKPVTKLLKEIGQKFEPDHVGSTDLYFQLYFMTETRGLRHLQNLAMDRIREYYAAEKLIAGYQRCEEIYLKTKTKSPMRAFMVQQFLSVHFSKAQSRETIGKALITRLRMKNGEVFMLDMFEALRCKASKKGWPSPNEAEGCVFHRHVVGEECGD